MSLIIILALIFVQDFADFLDENSDKIVKLGVNQQCNPVASICSASIINEGDFQRISLAIKQSMPINKQSGELDLTLSLNAVGFDFEGIESLAVVFELLDSDEEAQRIAFVADKSSNQVVPENWQARLKVSLPENSRDCFATVNLKSSKKQYRAEFPCHLIQ